jgi:hypothetical protein
MCEGEDWGKRYYVTRPMQIHGLSSAVQCQPGSTIQGATTDEWIIVSSAGTKTNSK